ncbi:MAG TPA: 50S ribosomal protein L18 [Deltaproteobacteria bacterium]|nr:50S ribosomal protein L18 [Deltaproteobacteria bacterium]
MSVELKKARKIRRHRRLRNRVSGTAQRPRLSVFKSNLYMYAQLINDIDGKTIASASNLEKEFVKIKGAGIAAAEAVGTLVAERAIEKGVKEVVFDRSGYQYHGCVKALADAARKVGLKF